MTTADDVRRVAQSMAATSREAKRLGLYAQAGVHYAPFHAFREIAEEGRELRKLGSDSEGTWVVDIADYGTTVHIYLDPADTWLMDEADHDARMAAS